MKTAARHALLGLALLSVAGCDLVSGDDDDLDLGVVVPSQEEADDKADATITAKNADAEFEKLQAEIDSEN